ncbi:MAG: NUDIX domain-containing protein [Deinococcota bacterium]
MPIPEFIVDLRTKIGHDLVLLPGTVGVVQNAAGEVLCLRRSDTGAWSLPSGIVEPGEQPAQTMTREIYEETNVRARVTRILAVITEDIVHYTNGDQAQYVTIVFACDALTTDLNANDGEALELQFFPPDNLPEIRLLTKTIDLATLLREPTTFVWNEDWLV